jgi:RNA polymerase sigma-B factor
VVRGMEGNRSEGAVPAPRLPAAGPLAGRRRGTPPSGSVIAPPSAPDRDLLLRFHRGGDLAARDALVNRFLPMARRLAHRYGRGNEPLDDLIQVASLGLVKAINRFDPERMTAFSSFAVPTIMGELKRHFRDRGWTMRVPRELQETVLRLDRAVEDLSGTLGRAPSPAEVASHLGLSVEQVLEGLQAADAYRPVSLDRPVTDQNESGDRIADSVGREDPGFAQAEQGATLERLLTALGRRDREILWLRFREDLTQSEIAERVGVSQMHVSRSIRHALERLREAAAEG